MAQRDQWNSRVGFILAAAGSAVGLGNIWRFPYLTGEHGGGAFLVLYLALAFSIGISVLLAELAIGRAAKLSPASAIRRLHGGVWTLAGYFGVVAAFIVLSFYSVVGGWTLAYVVKALGGGITGAATSAEQAFKALTADPVMPLLYHGVFMALTVGIVLRGVGSGIEKASKWLMPILFLLLLLLITRALTLPGAMAGVSFYLTLDFSKVTGATVIAALSQAFFSLSVGLGAMITYGSYLDSRENLPRSVLWIVSVDTGVAVLAGLLIFPAVFAFGLDPASGPGLSFITLPAVFDQMPGGQVFAVAFFTLLALAALTSSVSLLEVPVAHLIDNRGIVRRRAAILLGAAVFLLGIPSTLSLGMWRDYTLFGLGFMDLMDVIAIRLMIPLGGILFCLFAGWIVFPRMVAEITGGAHPPPFWLKPWSVLCKVIAPAAILWILVAGLVA